jgi:NtrC-family two-component system response regulator AlgB
MNIRLTERKESTCRALPVELRSSEPKMHEVLGIALKIAASDATILLRGESGTGKGLLARVIHVGSPRAAGPFAAIQCPGLSVALLESELFGKAQAVSTGALRDTVSKLRIAEGGTLLLDEIGDLPLELQPKVLRLLQERSYERLRETQTQGSDVRLIATTNRNLEAEVAAGRFREDLFYRLNLVQITLPPLRERRADILPLAEDVLRSFGRQTDKAPSGFAEPVRDALLRYSWPGNIRELRNAIQRAAILASGFLIELHHLPSQITSPGQTIQTAIQPTTLDQMEIEQIRRVLSSAGTIGEAAAQLGIDPSTLYRKRKKYGMRRVRSATVTYDEPPRDA